MPARNEARHLKKIVATIPDFVDEVIVVSNCSTDATVTEAKKLGLTILVEDRTKHGIGYGYAHMMGLSKAKGSIIVGADADGTYPLGRMAEMIDFMIEQKVDFVSGNRFSAELPNHIPRKLRLGVKLLNIETRILYGIRIQDILSGMWLVRAKVVPDLDLTEGDWNLSPQVKVNAARNKKLCFREFPIHQNKRYGITHQKYFKTGLSHAFWLLKNRLKG